MNQHTLPATLSLHEMFRVKRTDLVKFFYSSIYSSIFIQASFISISFKNQILQTQLLSHGQAKRKVLIYPNYQYLVYW